MGCISWRSVRMKRIIGGLVLEPMASTPLSHRKIVLLTDPILLTDAVLLTERSRRQQGMMALKEMLG